MKVLDIVKDAIKKHGADGLYNADADNCGCGIDDLCTCGMCCDECELAKEKDGLYYPVRTSEEWSKNYKFKILDPDGWDRKNFEHSWKEELITFSEFERRAMMSTCVGKEVTK